jgi:hypothetical protein
MNHHELSLEEVARVANGLGAESIRNLSSLLPAVDAKYGERSLGQVEAFLNMIKPTDLDRLLTGEASIKIEEVIRKFFDKNGRMIPMAGMKSAVCDPNKDFHLIQPQMVEEVDFANRILRLHGTLGIDTDISGEQMFYATKTLLDTLRVDPRTTNLLNAVYLPVIIPKTEIGDIGTLIEQWLVGVDKSHKKTFGERAFNNYLKGALTKAVSIVSESRHDRLIEQMKQGPIIGLYFPNPLQGFSVDADREQMATLPEEFILSGLDAIIGMIMYPDVLARDWKTPGIDLAAFFFRSADGSLCFRASGGNLGDARGRCSGGLFFSR